MHHNGLWFSLSAQVTEASCERHNKPHVHILALLPGQIRKFRIWNPEVPDLAHVALMASWFENPEVLGSGI